MKVRDPGHVFELDALDGGPPQILAFVKREGEGYPGNVGHHPGTTMQEVLRALISRALYVGHQIPCEETDRAVQSMRQALIAFEERAADRHGRPRPEFGRWPERQQTCRLCGHVGCPGICR